jgi:hypothetical protein
VTPSCCNLQSPRGLIQERSPAFLHRSVLRGQVRPSQVISARTEVLHEMPESMLKVVRIFLWLMRSRSLWPRFQHTLALINSSNFRSLSKSNQHCGQLVTFRRSMKMAELDARVSTGHVHVAESISWCACVSMFGENRRLVYCEPVPLGK